MLILISSSADWCNYLRLLSYVDGTIAESYSLTLPVHLAFVIYEEISIRTRFVLPEFNGEWYGSGIFPSDVQLLTNTKFAIYLCDAQ